MPGPFSTSLALALLAAISPLEEKPKLSENDWQVQIELMAVVVPQKLALEILDAPLDEPSAKNGLQKVMAAVEQGTATVAGTQTVRTEHGVEKTAHSGETLRYASSFEMPEFPDFDRPGEVAALPKDLAVFELPADDYSTQDLGLKLTATPDVSPNGEWLRITATLDHVRLLQWDEIHSGVTPRGARIVARQPRFSTVHSEGVYYLRSGASTLAGCRQLPGGKAGEMELFYLRARTARKPPAPIPRAPLPPPPTPAPAPAPASDAPARP